MFWIISIIVVAVMVVIMATTPTATATMTMTTVIIAIMTMTTVIIAIVIMTTAVASMAVASTLCPRRKIRAFTKGWEGMAKWSATARAALTTGVGIGIYRQRELLWNSNLTRQPWCISGVCVRAMVGKI